MKTIMTIIVIVMSLATLAGADDIVGGRSGAFLRTPVGVRAVGLGGSYVGVADDATSMFWNTAGLAQIEGPMLQASHTSMGLDRQHSFLSGAMPSADGKAVIGVMWDRFAVSNIQGRDHSGEPTTMFDDQEHLIAGGVAVRMGALSLGGGIRYYQHDLAEYKGDGLGYDAGGRLDLEFGETKVALGASMTDMNASLEWDTPSAREDIIPAVTRIGGAVTLPVGSTSLMVSAAMHTIEDEDGFLSFGAEYVLTDALQLRAGMFDDHYAVGATVAVRSLAFSFALAEDIVENASYLTVGLDLGR